MPLFAGFGPFVGQFVSFRNKNGRRFLSSSAVGGLPLEYV
jgi:hypothetical protein